MAGFSSTQKTEAHKCAKGIDFDYERWAQAKKTYDDWWHGDLNRPIIPVVIENRRPARPQPAAPLLTQQTCADLSIPAEDIIDRIDYELSKFTYLGDAFPFFGMDCFGPGVMAAFLGAKMDNSTGLVWFHAPEDLPLEQLHFQFDPDNIWFRRIAEIYRAGMERWEGQVLMGMTDLGGTLDILSTFRPGEKLLLDLYDNPIEVKRLMSEIHSAWHHCYKALQESTERGNPGYSDWSGIYSSQPGYMLQCDFSYMIGPEMFEEFAKPDLAAHCAKLANPFYHLDGKGQLVHLDSLLSIPELKGVQWIPGAGQPDCKYWPEVYGKIRSAGKRIQLLGDFDTLDAVVAQLGGANGIHLKPFTGQDEKQVRSKLEAYMDI